MAVFFGREGLVLTARLGQARPLEQASFQGAD